MVRRHTAKSALFEFLPLRFNLLGAIDYLFRRDRWNSRPFNDQRARAALFVSLVARCAPTAIVETGTHFGATTKYLARTRLPVYSVEFDRRTYDLVKARLWRLRNVHLKRGDSRAALRVWLEGPLRDRKGWSILFYLDAHSVDSLPLGEEIGIIFDRCSKAIVMIDDFRVPFDDGYGYDDYGEAKALVPAYIQPLVCSFQLRTFYPSTPSAEETGNRRGCVILVKADSLIKIMESMPLLRGSVEQAGPITS
jgi:hypothetical protein